MSTTFDYTGWPQRLREVAEITSSEAALALAEEYGGVPIYIPKAPDEKCKLVPTIGLQALKKLAAVYGGDWLIVPRGVNLEEGKKGLVLALLRDGLSLRQTAVKAKVSMRYVARLAALVRGKERQLPLPLNVDSEHVQNV